MRLKYDYLRRIIKLINHYWDYLGQKSRQKLLTSWIRHVI